MVYLFLSFYVKKIPYKYVSGIPIIKKHITEFVVVVVIFAFKVQSRDSRKIVVTVTL